MIRQGNRDSLTATALADERQTSLGVGSLTAPLTARLADERQTSLHVGSLTARLADELQNLPWRSLTGDTVDG